MMATPQPPSRAYGAENIFNIVCAFFGLWPKNAHTILKIEEAASGGQIR